MTAAVASTVTTFDAKTTKKAATQTAKPFVRTTQTAKVFDLKTSLFSSNTTQASQVQIPTLSPNGYPFMYQGLYPFIFTYYQPSQQNKSPIFLIQKPDNTTGTGFWNDDLNYYYWLFKLDNYLVVPLNIMILILACVILFLIIFIIILSIVICCVCARKQHKDDPEEGKTNAKDKSKNKTMAFPSPVFSNDFDDPYGLKKKPKKNKDKITLKDKIKDKPPLLLLHATAIKEKEKKKEAEMPPSAQVYNGANNDGFDEDQNNEEQRLSGSDPENKSDEKSEDLNKNGDAGSVGDMSKNEFGSNANLTEDDKSDGSIMDLTEGEEEEEKGFVKKVKSYIKNL